MTAHTPGPWIAIHSIPEEGYECFWLRAQPGGGICRGFSQEIGTINGPQSGEQEANARLIAAAPDLLAFITEWLSRQGDDVNYMTEKARAAIAKAKGDSA